MATTETHSVMPSGGDYTTLDAALDHVLATHHDLVTDDKIQAIKIDGTWSSADTAAATIGLLHTDATRYLYIYTTATARHAGVWSTSKYILSVAGAHALTLGGACDYFWIDGLQILKSAENANYQACISFGTVGLAAGSWQRISNCILKGDNNNTYRSMGIYGEAANQNFQIWNTIEYGHGTTNNALNCSVYIGNGAATAYSSTFIGGNCGMYRGGGTMTAKNVYCSGTSNAFNGVGASFAMTNCASSDTTAEDTDAHDSVAHDTDTFVNVTYATADYHLAADGLSPLQGHGVDTTGDSAPFDFTTDIDGQTRDATWDIGADAWYVAPATDFASDLYMVFTA